VAQRNLAIDADLGPVKSSLLNSVFDGFDGGVYIPRRYLN